MGQLLVLSHVAENPLDAGLSEALLVEGLSVRVISERHPDVADAPDGGVLAWTHERVRGADLLLFLVNDQILTELRLPNGYPQLVLYLAQLSEVPVLALIQTGRPETKAELANALQDKPDLIPPTLAIGEGQLNSQVMQRIRKALPQPQPLSEEQLSRLESERKIEELERLAANLAPWQLEPGLHETPLHGYEDPARWEKAMEILRSRNEKETEACEVARATVEGAYKAAKEFVEIAVYYITDRNPTGDTNPNRFYGGQWREGPLDRGVVRVSIPLPPVHVVGHVERPSLKKLQIRENPKLHVCLLGLDRHSEDEFKAEVRAALAEADERSVLLFVHGYNVSFAEAARRAAQVKYDLDFGGISLLYSWPSTGRTLLYSHDEQNIRLSLPSFKQELAALLTICTPRPIVHIIAHSMGNRLVAPAVASLGVDRKRLLNQVIFTAPDLDAREFKQFAEHFHRVADKFTLYANCLDVPLWFSKGIHGGRRVGASGAGIVIFDGVDTIDASNVDTSLMGHSSWSEDRNVIRDIEVLLKEGLPPYRRGGLIPQGPDDARYWTFRP